jgi:hypothetical protein
MQVTSALGDPRGSAVNPLGAAHGPDAHATRRFTPPVKDHIGGTPMPQKPEYPVLQHSKMQNDAEKTGKIRGGKKIMCAQLCAL